MASFTKDFRIVLATNILTFVAGLIVQACLGKFLLVDGRGQYAVCVVVFANFLALVFSLGQEIAGVYMLSSKATTVSQVFTQNLLIGTLTSVIACSAGYVLTFTSLSFLNKAPMELFYFSLLIIPGVIFFQYYSRIFLGLSNFTLFSIVAIFPHLLNAIGLLLSGILGFSVKGAILVFAISQFSGALISIFFLIRFYNCKLARIDIGILKRSLSYGVRFYIGKLCAQANVQVGTIVLSFVNVTSTDLGLFAAMMAIVSRVWMLPDAIQVTMLPRTSADKKGEPLMMSRNVRVCLAVCFLAICAMFVLGKWIILFILNPAFLEGLILYNILLLGVLLRIIPKVLAAYFNGIDKPQITSMGMAISISTNIFLTLILCPIFGVKGVAVATTISFILEAGFMSICFAYISKLKYSSLFLLNGQDIDLLKSKFSKYVGNIKGFHKNN